MDLPGKLANHVLTRVLGGHENNLIKMKIATIFNDTSAEIYPI